MLSLTNKRVILGITGGIAAYKCAELTRLLAKAGAEVRVAMTKSAVEFITPLTMQALSGNRVHLEVQLWMNFCGWQAEKSKITTQSLGK